MDKKKPFGYFFVDERSELELNLRLNNIDSYILEFQLKSEGEEIYIYIFG